MDQASVWKRERVWWYLLLGLGCLGVANVQSDATNQTGWTATLLADYARGTLGDAWNDGVSPIIVRARILLRLLLHPPVKWFGIPLATANIVWQTAFLLAGARVLEKLALSVPGVSRDTARMAVLLALLVLNWGFLQVGYKVAYPYDLPAFAFVCFGLWAIAMKKEAAFLLILFLGTLNKETLLFLVPVFALQKAGGLGWKAIPPFLVAGGVYTLAYALPRLILEPDTVGITASASAGDLPRFTANLLFVAGRNLPHAGQHVFWILALHIPALLCFRRLPSLLKQAYLFSPLFWGPMLIFGNLNEFRLFNEMIPLAVLGWVSGSSAFFRSGTNG